MKGRFQLPAYAKFNRPDPMRDWNWLAPHTINLYEYVGNDPINAWDPDGHSGEGPVRDTLTILKSAWDSFWHSAGEAVAAPLIAATYTFFAINEDLNQLSEYESTLGQSGSLSFSNTRSLAGGVISSASDSAKNGIHFAADTFTQLVINPDALVGTVSEHYGDVSPEEFGNKLGSFSFGMASAFAPASKGLSFGTSVSQSSNFEMFYRTMSEADFAHLAKTGNLPATKETFTSLSQAYASKYEGTLVSFKMQEGTLQALEGIGVRDTAGFTSRVYPDMPVVSKGWTTENAFFKTEGAYNINVGLGKGEALKLFNERLIEFSVD